MLDLVWLSTVTAEVRTQSLGWHPDPLPYRTLGSLPGLCTSVDLCATRDGWQEGQGLGRTSTNRHCCGHLLWRPAAKVCFVCPHCCHHQITSHPPACSPQGFCRDGRGLTFCPLCGWAVRSPWLSPGTLGIVWAWEEKFIFGAAMKCSENCFHVLVNGEAP